MLSKEKNTILFATAMAFFGAVSGALADDQAGTVLAQFELNGTEASGAPLTGFFDRILSGTKSFEGNKSAKYFVSIDDPSQILLLEEWESKEDFDAYLDWRIKRGDFAELKSLLEAEPVLTFYQR